MLIGIDASRATIEQRTGTENYSRNLILAILNLDRQNKYKLYLKEDLELPESSLNNVSKRIINLPRLWTQLGLAVEVSFDPPDLLFIPAHTLPIIKRPGLKTVVTIHDLGYEFLADYHKFPQRLYLNRSTIYAASQASHLIAVSEATKGDLVNKLKVNPDKVSVVYEGFDSKTFKRASKIEVDRVREKYNLKNPYILFVGTIQPRKNLENLIKAYAKVASSSNFDLVLSGKSGWLNDEIFNMPAKFGLEKRVIFTGFTPDPDLPALYSGAKAFVFPSLFEGFGLPILEAFACGVPVLTSNTSSMPEVADYAALFVEPYDIDSISGGILQITSNNRLRDQLVKRGTERLRYFSWDKAAKQTIEVFNKVLKSS